MRKPQPNRPLTELIIGGLVMHGSLSASTITTLCDGRGLSYEAAGRAVLDLINQGLVSVTRDGCDGYVAATPALGNLPQTRRTRAVIAYLAASKAVAHA